MPAVFTPPPVQRGTRKFEPPAEAIEDFVRLLKPGVWVAGDEEADTYNEVNRYSTTYRNDLAATGKLPDEVKARHFATDKDGNVLRNAPKEGGEGVTWRFCLALKGTE